MLARCLAHLRQLAGCCLHAARTHLSALTKPASPSLATGLVTDLLRSKQDLVLENALRGSMAKGPGGGHEMCT